MTCQTSAFKLSRYLVASDSIAKNSYRMLFSTRTTGTLLIRETVYQELLDGLFERIETTLFERLQKVMIVVPANENELDSVIADNKRAIVESTVLYTAVAPSADCQLGCDYCGQTHSKEKMNNATHDKVLARIERKLRASGSFKKIRIGWFGAEPLTGLKSIYAMSARLKKMADDYCCTYGAQMVTNGLALTPDVYFNLATECGVDDFEITLDGAQKSHDARRYTKRGHASFGLIMKNLVAIVHDPRFNRQQAQITIRCNVDSRNHASTTELIDFLEAQGVLDKVNFYTAPVHSWGNDAHREALNQQSYADFEIDVFSRLLGKKIEISVLPEKAQKIVCMSLQKDAELIDSFGDVYNCSEISQVAAYKEVKIYKLDHLDNQGAPLLSERPFSHWNDDIRIGKVPCHHCRILPICGGACPKLWGEGISPCPPIKENIEQRLILQMVTLKQKGMLNA
jgi:uncharacterized protein